MNRAYQQPITEEDSTWRVFAAISDAPDLGVILLWALLVSCLATFRVSFTGDGIRHLWPILVSSRPSLGKPRWLLFPALLFVVIKPLQLAGLVSSVEQAAHAFVILNFLAGVIYMLLVRRWLIVRSVGAHGRAAALLLAGMTTPLLLFSGDTVEPIIPATIALAGLVYAASQSPDRQRRAIVVAAAALVLATLLYQGLVLAMALVPCAFPRNTRIRLGTIALFSCVLALAPLTMFFAMVAGGSSPHAAIHQMLAGEENELYKAEMKSKTRGLWPYVAAVSVGPAENIIPIPENRGISGGFKMALRRDTVAEGIFNLAGFVFALILLFGGVALVVRRRDWRIAVAFAGILVLPLIRSFQYSYTKFYILMPAIVALVASSVSPLVGLFAGIVAGSFNTLYIARDIVAQRRLSNDIAPLFKSMGDSSCYVTTSWGPPTMNFPGSTCSISAILSRDTAEQVDLIMRRNQHTMNDSLRRCFCDSSSVLTDDVTEANQDVAAELLKYYRYSGFELNEWQWNPNRGTLVFDRDGLKVFSYSRQAQSEICSGLKFSLKPND